MFVEEAFDAGVSVDDPVVDVESLVLPVLEELDLLVEDAGVGVDDPVLVEAEVLEVETGVVVDPVSVVSVVSAIVDASFLYKCNFCVNKKQYAGNTTYC